MLVVFCIIFPLFPSLLFICYHGVSSFCLDLIDSIELEKKVADLKKELEKSHEDERTLQAKIKDLSALQDLPDKVDSLMKQVTPLFVIM